MANDIQAPSFITTENLIDEGKALPEPIIKKWPEGQGMRQVAYLSFSSGTSGLPKAVMITHYNVIANIIQLSTYESFYRKKQNIQSQTLLGLLPFSHAYGLVVMAHVAPYRGDEVIVLPKYKLETLLAAVQQFSIEQINIAPPILVQMVSNYDKCKQYNLSSIRFIYTGGAPLASETMKSLSTQYPKWHIGQIYGMTETAVCVTSTSESDMVPGSAGSLIPGVRAKIIDNQGNEVTTYDTPGELLVQGPALYAKGMQVAPAELEAHLLTHPFVSDCAVIQVSHEHCGEVPKAFVVMSREAGQKPENEVEKAICEDVKKNKAHYKWLVGGVEFTEAIPKSPTGKILRRVLREKEKKSRKAKEPNL
ncbi:amp-binding enzyme [Trichoderma arundinaceum]|uniref:Amp-binding enzyme n=1 Tax=Trichoderma arundinaceum TaxID=490622 RepID=A0A395NIL3_TRIAR|nr:amp-binding enzyme [Trichoderma arundinaceum]